MGEEFYPPPQNEPLKSPPRLGLSRSLTIYDVCQSTVVYFANNCSFFAFIYGYLSKRKQKKIMWHNIGSKNHHRWKVVK